MLRLWIRLLLALVAFSLASSSLLVGAERPVGTFVEPWVDTANRDAVLVAWETERAHPVPDMDWDGAYDGCRPGSSSKDLALATVRRVNFYRAMAGVPATVRLSPEYSAKAQHGALTMSATGKLSHTPGDDYRCLDDLGREAAANSNLYLGRTGPAAIDGYIEDPGERNRDVGHRNTILHPPTVEIGVGHVAGTEDLHAANALWVFDDRVFDDNPPLREPEGFVAWPPRGHVPHELTHPRWSFGLADANFDRASVAMTVEGEPVALEVVTRHSLQGYVPAPIIVWEPDPLVWPTLIGDREPEQDLVAEVVIDAVSVEGETRRFSYEVVIMADRTSTGGRLVTAMDATERLVSALLGR